MVLLLKTLKSMEMEIYDNKIKRTIFESETFNVKIDKI